MSIDGLIDKLKEIRAVHGNLRIGVDDYNSGWGGTFDPAFSVDGQILEISASGSKIEIEEDNSDA